MLSRSRLDRVKRSFLGGAVGDALEAGIEFLSLREIRQRSGLFGVQDFVPGYHVAIIDHSDDPFTAEGLMPSALAHHVPRTAPMGAPVLINGSWYKASARRRAALCMHPPCAAELVDRVVRESARA